MADQPTKKKSSTAKKPSAPAKKSAGGKAGGSGKTGGGQAAGSKKAPQKAKSTQEKNERKIRFMRNFMPYILGAIALFLGATFIIDLFAEAGGAPSEHPMGVFGYYICYALLGCLSWVAYLIPAVLILLIIFWQKYFRTGRVTSKIVLSVLLLLLLASFTHVIHCAADPDMATVDIPLFFETGAERKSGGVIGGLIGYLLFLALRLPGNIVLLVITLPLILMCLCDVTPRDVFDRIKERVVAAKEESEDEEDDDEEDEDDGYYGGEDAEDDDEDAAAAAPPPAKNRQKKKPAAAQARREEHGAEAPDHEAGETTDTAAEDDHMVLVDTHTGEVSSYAPRTKGRAAATPPPVEVERTPWDEPADSDDYAEEDDEIEQISVGFDDEPTTAAGRHRTGQGVTYERTNDAAGADVRIYRADNTPMEAGGLSEEELVLPSGDPNAAEVSDEQEYVFPELEMLTRGPDHYASNDEEIAENTQILRDVLQSFRIGVREIECSCGPTVTRFEVKPDTGVRVRSISNLIDDIAMGLAKAGVRIEAPIPGKSAVGIEVPNAEPSTVYLRNILETPEFRNHKSRISVCLGADVAGRPVIMDINKMPHLLIAGATGTGKSVCINSLIMSILYKSKPDEVKLILIDPKKVEFAMYRDLPHLYAPVVTDPKKAAGALNSAVNEMERRFELIEEVGVRNLAGYNEITAGDPERPPLPQMIIVIDELADLMMTAPAEVETAICRLAQKARAAGIHLVIGTQRPSVDVITGLIKANIPSRIAFTVKAAVDSRTILDTIGAEKLIGRGDMLYAPIGSTKPIRVQGALVTESEVETVVTYIKQHNAGPVYNEDFTHSIEVEAAKCAQGRKKGDGSPSADDFDGIGAPRDGEDPKFWEALEIAVTKEKIGTSALQRGCNLGYGRAAKIIDRMEELGFVGPDPGTKQGRRVLITKQDLIQYKLNGLPGAGGAASDATDADDPDEI